MADATLARSDFYVYVLFYHDTGLPFYVGKGTKVRISCHRYRHETPRKRAIIKRAIDCGAEVPSIKLATGLTENEAFSLERVFIAAIGREMDGGTLINLTKGGDGGHAGRIPSPETIAKISARLKGRVLSEGHKARIGDANKRRVWTEQARINRGVASSRYSKIAARGADGKFGGEKS